MCAVAQWFPLLLLASVLSVTLCRLPHSHVIRMSPQLRAHGFQGDVAVGEVVGEARVDSAHACGSLCQDHPECRTVMFFPPLCRMFAQPQCTVSQCSPELTYIAQTGRYLLGDNMTRSYEGAMEKCLDLGAHSVHINSREEHDVIREYVASSGVQCTHIWTGGKSLVAGSKVMADWHWHFDNNPEGETTPFTYLAWMAGQPNNVGGGQDTLILSGEAYEFNDLEDSHPNVNCFLCECNEPEQ